MVISTRHARPFALAAVAGLLLLGLAALAPAAQAAEQCTYARGLGTVCRELSIRRTCVWSTQAPTTTDVAALQKQCLHHDERDGATVVCAQTVAGVGTRGGARSAESVECVATWEQDTARCILLFGSVDRVTWQMNEPLCAVEPIPVG